LPPMAAKTCCSGSLPSSSGSCPGTTEPLASSLESVDAFQVTTRRIDQLQELVRQRPYAPHSWSSMLDRVELDHVLIAVTDLATAAREIQERYGLGSVEGGHHPGWGTANRIVPLGTSYLELIAVVDQQAAADTIVGRWVAGGASPPGRPLGWAVRTGKLDAIARRLGLSVSAGSRVAPTGEVLRWRSAGIEQAAIDCSLPFFIEWERGMRLPGNTAVAHSAAPAGISKLLLQGDPSRLAAWLGNHTLPIVVRAGSPAVAAIVLSSATGEIVLGVEQL
jgi:hypothetical protein